ncbi:MAG TPA: ASPIC/UnbV domain-containing protein, partial [Chitinophagaceae bacterium]|nr:ASPIC/UnbV domain-containing protein [Chitinophagaceae bacterium]
TDLDYISYSNGQGGGSGTYTLAMTDSLPVVKLANYAFKNKTGTSFENTTQAWGFERPAFSNGAAYADLDNDGDLDVVINNIDDECFVYENTLNNTDHHYLSVSIAGAGMNKNGYGTQLHLYYSGKQLFYEHEPARGYLSTDDGRAHFGLGDATQADSLVVLWPDGRQQVLTNIKANQTITVAWENAADRKRTITGEVPYFIKSNDRYSIHFKPQERDFVDYNIQRTMPHKLSQYGPGLAVGDIDNNGYDDFYVGGSSGNPGVFFMQGASGTFTPDSNRLIQKDDPLYEDMGVLFFDADNDKDLDLYLVSGSYEIPPNHPISNDRLYLNNGKGKFTKATGA